MAVSGLEVEVELHQWKLEIAHFNGDQGNFNIQSSQTRSADGAFVGVAGFGLVGGAAAVVY